LLEGCKKRKREREREREREKERERETEKEQERKDVNALTSLLSTNERKTRSENDTALSRE